MAAVLLDSLPEEEEPRRPSRWRRLLSPRRLLTVVPVAVITLVGGALSWQYNEHVRASRDLVLHSHQVMLAAQRVQLLAEDIETAQRGFVLTGEENFLEPAVAAERDLPAALGELDRLVQDSPVQAESVVRLAELATAHVTNHRWMVAERRAGNAAGTREAVADQRGKLTMDAMRDLLGGILAEERRVLGERRSWVQGTERWLIAVGVLSGLLSVLARAVTGAWVKRRIRRRPPE
jgi:CHASE3 domain sensor protein